MERKPFNLQEHLSGNTSLLSEILKNPDDVIVVYDADGIIINSLEVVFAKFAQRTGIEIPLAEIDRWNMLTHVATTKNMPEKVVASAEEDWYKPEVLAFAPRHLFSKPLVNLTLKHVGEERNYILTARNSDFRDATYQWFGQVIPGVRKDNILIRDEKCKMEPAEYKVSQLRRLAKEASWVIFIEDTIEYIETALNEGPENCLVVNVPLGLMAPDFEHERLIVVGRYPNKIQGMYPTYRLFKDAIRKATQNA